MNDDNIVIKQKGRAIKENLDQSNGQLLLKVGDFINNSKKIINLIVEPSLFESYYKGKINDEIIPPKPLNFNNSNPLAKKSDLLLTQAIDFKIDTLSKRSNTSPPKIAKKPNDLVSNKCIKTNQENNTHASITLSKDDNSIKKPTDSLNKPPVPSRDTKPLTDTLKVNKSSETNKPKLPHRIPQGALNKPEIPSRDLKPKIDKEMIPKKSDEFNKKIEEKVKIEIGKLERIRYLKLFDELNNNQSESLDGILITNHLATIIRKCFRKSKINDKELAHLWSLMDPNKMGKLCKNRFIYSVYLIDKRLNGEHFPKMI